MCMPHGSAQTVSSGFQKKERNKKSIPFNEKLMKPDPDFVDERVKTQSDTSKERGVLDTIFSFLKG